MANSDGFQVYKQYLTCLRETPQTESSDDTDVFGIKQHKPKYPHYAVESKRLESFKPSPDVLREKSTNLAEAGLVYTGERDSVRCFDCGDELRDWKRDDDPWKEHARLNPNCQHVLRVKGQQYIDRVKRGEKPEDGSKSEVVDLINTPAAQACIQTGYPTEQVQMVLDRHFRSSGNSSLKAKAIAAILEDMPEEQRSFNNDNERTIYLQTTMTSTDNLVCYPCGHLICRERCTPVMSNCPECEIKLSGVIVLKPE